MKANPAPMSVADYCHEYNDDKIKVNDQYQRNDSLWSSPAQSFFIESILLEYPIPKMYLYARLDLRTRRTVKEIVDGQQRSQALAAFFNGKLRLSKHIETEELRGLKYNQIGEEWQTKFLGYSLPIDQFVGVPEDEVREAFRRMNANNVPLNDEEQRNARFQGPFKWFVISLAEQFSETLFKLGLFSRRDLVRMGDFKFYAEISLTLDQGFQTVKGKQLDDLYKKYNSAFAREEDFRQAVPSALIATIQSEETARPVFLRSHVYQSIVLATMAVQTPVTFVDLAKASQADVWKKLEGMPLTFALLDRALQDPDAHPDLADFVSACTQKTNVEASRAIRFLYFYKAVLDREAE